jgi:hypothetical protein
MHQVARSGRFDIIMHNSNHSVLSGYSSSVDPSSADLGERSLGRNGSQSEFSPKGLWPGVEGAGRSHATDKKVKKPVCGSCVKIARV